MTLLEKVRESRAAIAKDVADHIADAENRTDANPLTTDEAAGLTWFLAVKRAEDDECIARENELVEAERRAAVAAGSPVVHAVAERRSDEFHVQGEPRAYAKGDGNSYFLDQARVISGLGDAVSARGRLLLHGKQTDSELQARDKVSPFERRTNPNRTDGTGGYFVPPVWLIDQYVGLFRAGRTTADLVRNVDLPSGTDSINIPKVNTGTSAAIQTADAASVSSTDMTDTVVSGGVKTIAGQQDIALQLLEQSPIAFDEVIVVDLMRAYNVALDKQVLSGSNVSGQVKGILTMSGTNAVTYTDASPTVPELYPFLAGAISQASYAAGGHFDLSSCVFVMHPRRWFWMLGAVDGNLRPLVVPDGPAFNQVGVSGAPTVAAGRVGTLIGVPVYIDANIPVTNGGGTEDQILFVKTDDVFLFEGAVRTRALMEVLSGTLQVRLQLYNYCAVIADRLAGAHSVISGTGLAAPSGY